MNETTQMGAVRRSPVAELSREMLAFALPGCAILLVVVVLMVRWPLLAWLVFGLVAPCVVVRASRRPDANAFNLVKAASVAVASLAVLVAVLLGPGHPGHVAVLIVVVFALNILEAVVSDAIRGHWLNVAAGLALLLTIPSPEGIHVPAEYGGVMLYAIEPLWLLTYTVWNWAFVASRAPRTAKVHAAVLLAPLLAQLWLPGLWGQARAYTLGCQQLLCLGSPQVQRGLEILDHDERLGAAGRACQLISLLLGGWMICCR